MSSEQSKKQSRNPGTETQKSSGVIGDLLRLVIIGVLIGVGAWYFYFSKSVAVTAKEMTGKTMGTDFLVKVADFPVTDDAEAWPNFAAQIQARLDEIDRLMSTYKSDSDVSRFNASDSIDWFEVSPATADVIKLALEISKLTDGAFDITAAPVVNPWGFGPEKTDLTVEDLKKQASELKSRIGYEKLEVRMTPPAIKKSIPELTIDLSAIAKGYAVDAVVNLLENNKLANYMIEVGGEVRCKGHKGTTNSAGSARPEPWLIGIENPLIVPPGEFPGIFRKLKLAENADNNALATSGNYRNFKEVDGMWFSHIVDPQTGLPTEMIPANETGPNVHLGSVSVIDKSCARADALATALFVLGEEKGLKLAEQNGIAVLFLYRQVHHEDAPVGGAFSPSFPLAPEKGIVTP